MGEAKHPEAETGQPSVALPVELELVAAAVELPAVQLDDQPLLAPQRVHLDPGDHDVPLRLPERAVLAQAPEEALELAATPVARAPQPRGGPSAGHRRGAQLMGSEGEEDLCLVQGSLE